jgi:hypothetical protein
MAISNVTYSNAFVGTATQTGGTWSFVAVSPLVDGDFTQAVITSVSDNGSGGSPDGVVGTITAVSDDNTGDVTTYPGPFEVMAQATDGSGNEWYLLTDGVNSFLISEHVTTFSDPPYEFSNATLLDNPGTVCFLEGTRVLTRGGYVPIESLTPGDELLTLGGAWLPLRWLGRLEPRRGRSGYKPGDWPIRIVKDAFGAGLPTHDLLVSPDHAIFFRHHLIPAKCLVNGITVRRESPVGRLVYYHALLDSHAVIFSEALPTESYVPRENQRFFSNADSLPAELPVTRLAAAGWVRDCYPRVTSGPVVTSAYAHLARLAPESEFGQVA